MIITKWQLYWILQLDCIGKVSVVLFVVVFIALGIYLILCVPDKGKSLKTYSNKYMLMFLIPMLVLGAFATFLPSTKQMATIYVLPHVLNNKKVQQIPEELLDVSLNWLDELKRRK
jgi:hypothetical protein